MDCIDSVAFTDVCACVSGSVMARSSIKSEYAQSLVDPKRTLFDVNIERRRYSSDRLIGAVTALSGYQLLMLDSPSTGAEDPVVFNAVCLRTALH